MSDAQRPFDVVGPAGKLAGWLIEGRDGATGEPAVLLHGVNSAADDWISVARALAGDRTVVAFDFRGHGRSERAAPYTLEGYAADTVAVLDALDLRRAHLVGTSFGGGVALAVAAENPARVVSGASLGMPLKDAPGMWGEIDQALVDMGVRGFFEYVSPRYDFGPEADPEMVADAVDSASCNDLETVRAILEAAFKTDLEPVAVRVKRPVMVAVGERDETCPVEAVEPLAELVGSEVVVIPGASHSVHMEDPATVAHLLSGHLRTHDGAPGG